MATDKAALGKRYSCFECGAKFYDLNKEQAICPSCGADQANDPNPDPTDITKMKLRPTRRKSKPMLTEASESEVDRSNSEFFDSDNDGDGDGDGFDDEELDESEL